ncbi:hypothetical protein CYMTET_35752, partial [Cymbomonas tetramitiformis]
VANRIRAMDSPYNNIGITLVTDDFGKEELEHALWQLGDHHGTLFSNVLSLGAHVEGFEGIRLDNSNFDCTPSAECDRLHEAVKAGMIWAAAQMPYEKTILLDTNTVMCNDYALQLVIDGLDKADFAYHSSESAEEAEKNHGLLMFQQAHYPWHPPPNDGGFKYPEMGVFGIRKTAATQEVMSKWMDIYRCDPALKSWSLVYIPKGVPVLKCPPIVWWNVFEP